MPTSGSLVILAAAIGTVVCLFAGDYYYRYIDRKFSHLPLVELPHEDEDLDLNWSNSEDREDNIAA